MPTLHADSTIGGYQLIRLLGEGGMGEVWLGQDRLADRPVALKFIKPHLLSDPGFRTRFSNEAKTLGRLEHDRIVTLYNVLDEGDHLALVLRFIDGNSLADKVDSQGALPLNFVLSCARDILPALGFAHENGIIHRDIKPPNILVDSRSRCFLMDFGIAVAAFAERGTMTGLAIGTPHYMSPEQIRTPRDITPQTGGHRTDIYSFGIVLFEMLSGRVPFGQHSGVEDIYAIQHAQCNEPPPPLREINPNVPHGVEAAVMACLEKDPANRPQTCLELLNELESAAEGGGQSARTYAKTIVEARSGSVAQNFAPAPAASPAVRKKMPQQVWYGLAAVLIAGGIGIGIMTRGDKPTSNAQQPPPFVQQVTNTATQPQHPDRKRTSTSPGTPTVVMNPVVNPNPPTPKPASGPSPDEVEAAQDARDAKGLYSQGDYCGAKAKIDEALALHSKPEYLNFQKSAANGCNNAQ